MPFDAPPHTAAPSPALIRQWQRHLANERMEEQVYRRLAQRRRGEDRDILLSLADAERRHQQHWIGLLGKHAGRRRMPALGVLVLAALGRVFGSIFVLALAQQAEAKSPYDSDSFASDEMAADEKVHAEVIRALAAKSRSRLSGNFRAAVFGANDGLVSNLALVLGVGAAGLAPHQVLLTGISGLLAGALSMGAGEFVSVRSQRELLDASEPDPASTEVLPALNIDANELALVFRARGMTAEEAARAAETAIRKSQARAAVTFLPSSMQSSDHEELGTGLGAAAASFCFFASGAVIPILPYLLGATGLTAIVLAAGLVGLALLVTGGIVGILSGRAPLPRALRQLAIGFGAAGITYALGLLFGASAG
ncbi:VIT1/CCC1 family protein [Brevibacterium sp. BRM-1]|uniref:VIT1/CCC1 transporter family protein n=1 Tax=Brevibacterium sp. BRM-1 TaxID=2999062 RepID=UPI002281F229|nr:VIT1/CCC1 family protein [Brevibacterium sp. BRM-1]WAL39750.1 VIT1/CCC1 family protein [Brevibacterium sp. BRM-1]